MSVLAFAEPMQHGGVRLTRLTAEVLKQLRGELEVIVPVTFALGVTLPVVLMKTLNTFEFAPVHTAAIDSIVLDGMPAWDKIRTELRKQHVPERLLRRLQAQQ